MELSNVSGIKHHEVLLSGVLNRRVGHQFYRRWRREVLYLRSSGRFYELCSKTSDSFSKIFATCDVSFVSNWSQVAFEKRLIFYVHLMGQYETEENQFVPAKSCLLWSGTLPSPSSLASGDSFRPTGTMPRESPTNRGKETGFMLKLRADSLADMVKWLNVFYQIRGAHRGEVKEGRRSEGMVTSLSWIGRWDEIHPCMLDVQYQRSISENHAMGRSTLPARGGPLATTVRPSSKIIASSTSAKSGTTTGKVHLTPPSYDDVLEQIHPVRQLSRLKLSMLGGRTSPQECNDEYEFQEHQPLQMAVCSSASQSASHADKAEFFRHWIRRDEDDTFLPPYGPPRLWPVVMGQGDELGLPPHVQQLWDPNKDRILYVDHGLKCVYLDLPSEWIRSQRSKRNRRISTSSMFSTQQASPQLVDVALHETPQEVHRSRHNSTNVSQFRLSLDIERGATSGEAADPRWVTSCLQNYASRCLSQDVENVHCEGSVTDPNAAWTECRQEATDGAVQRNPSGNEEADHRSRRGSVISTGKASANTSPAAPMTRDHMAIRYRQSDVIELDALSAYRLSLEEAEQLAEKAKMKTVDLFLDAHGADGRDGADGRPGRDGPHGTHGKQGVGYGTDGEDGRPGSTGEQGSDGGAGGDGSPGRNVIVTLRLPERERHIRKKGVFKQEAQENVLENVNTVMAYFGTPPPPIDDDELNLSRTDDEDDCIALQTYLQKPASAVARREAVHVGYPLPVKGSAGVLLISTRGGNGGNGGNGGRGGNGGVGGSGGHGSRGMEDADGGQGGDGGCGGSGGHGGNGGNAGQGADAGNILIRAQHLSLFSLLEFDVVPGLSGKPGTPGEGGDGGSGGAGGCGGRPGESSAPCAVVLVNSDGKIISAGGSSTFDQRVLRPNAMLTTSGAVAAVGMAGHPTQTGQYGREGRNGMSGRSGAPGLAAETRIGKVGAVLWQLVDENERPVATFSSRYQLQVVDFKITASSDDEVFEPNENIYIYDVEVHNTGGMPLPAGSILTFPSTSTVLIFPGQTYSLPQIGPHESVCLSHRFHGRIHDVTTPNKPGIFQGHAVVSSLITLYNRPLDGTERSKMVTVRYPLVLESVQAPQQMGRGEESLLTVEVRNISTVAYGCDRTPIALPTPERALPGESLVHLSMAEDVSVSLRIRLDRRLAVSELKMCSPSLCGRETPTQKYTHNRVAPSSSRTSYDSHSGGIELGFDSNTRKTRDSGVVTTPLSMATDSSAGDFDNGKPSFSRSSEYTSADMFTHNTHSHEEDKVVSSSSCTSPSNHHQLYADMKEANSAWCELVGLQPNDVNHVHIRLNLENRAELFDRVLVQVELYLRNKLIEYKQSEIRVAPYYSGLPPLGKALFVTGPHTTRASFLQWQYLMQCAGLTPEEVDYWDTERYGGLSYHQTSEQQERQRHQVTWVNRYHDRLIIYPNYDFRVLAGWDISDHFHGPHDKNEPGEHDDLTTFSGDKKFVHDSGMLLVMPQHTSQPPLSRRVSQHTSSRKVSEACGDDETSTRGSRSGRRESFHTSEGLVDSLEAENSEFVHEQARLLGTLALLKVPSTELPHFGGVHLFSPKSSSAAAKRLWHILDSASEKLSNRSRLCVAYTRTTDYVSSMGRLKWRYGTLDVRGLAVPRSERLLLMASSPANQTSSDETFGDDNLVLAGMKSIPIASYWAQAFLGLLSVLTTECRSELLARNPATPVFSLPWGEELHIAQLAALSLESYLAGEVHPGMKRCWRYERVCSDMVTQATHYSNSMWLGIVFLYLLQYQEQLSAVAMPSAKRSALVKLAKKHFDQVVHTLSRAMTSSERVSEALRNARHQLRHGSSLRFAHLLQANLHSWPHRLVRQEKEVLVDLGEYLVGHDYADIENVNDTKQILNSVSSFVNMHSSVIR